MHPALIILISCVVVFVVLSILSSIFAGPLAIRGVGKVIRKFDRDFEEKMTKQVAGKDEATARALVMAEVRRLDGEDGEDSKIDLSVGGEDLKCPPPPPPPPQDGTDEGRNLPILIHMRDGKAIRVTMCMEEYFDEKQLEKDLEKELNKGV